jgi:hypothetical protein
MLAPLSLAPSSWELGPTLVLLQVNEETLLVALAEKHLGVKPTGSSSRMCVAVQQRPTIRLESPAWGDAFALEGIGKHRKRGMRRGTQRYSLPQLGEVGQRDGSVPRPQSLWFKARPTTRGEFESIPRWSDALAATEELGVDSLEGNGWRYSAQSMTSNGSGSGASLHHEPRSQSSNWSSSDRFSLSSSASTSSIFTSSASTTSTSLTALSSGTISKRSSRGSVLQREKRFSNIKGEFCAICRQMQALNLRRASDGWDTLGVGRNDNVSTRNAKAARDPHGWR